jgi:hypothetical protein
VCKCVLPLGDNPIAVNKYINRPVMMVAEAISVKKIKSNIFRKEYI